MIINYNILIKYKCINVMNRKMKKIINMKKDSSSKNNPVDLPLLKLIRL